MEDKLLNESEKPGKLHFRILFISWAGWVFDFYDLILFSFLLLPIGLELHFSDIQLSYIMGTSLAATAIGGVIFGILSDKYGRKSMLQLTILTYSIGTFLCGIAPNLFSLLIFRIITGLGVGGEWATGQTYIGETFPPKMRGRYGAIMQTGAPFGILLASVVGGFLSPVIGWRACFFISVIPALIVIYIRKKLPESDVWVKRRNLTATISIKERSKFLTLLSFPYKKLFIYSLILAIFDMSA